MMEREDVVAALVAAAGGEVVGRTRLQKSVYLLERLGFRSGFDDFSYYHYGPYSASLDAAVEDAKAFGCLEEESRPRLSDGAAYSVFLLKDGVDVKSEAFRGLGRGEVENLTRRFASTNATVMEIAATVDWLWRSEKFADWRSEVIKRKGVKTQNGRLEKAVAFLIDLGLAPPQPGSASA